MQKISPCKFCAPVGCVFCMEKIKDSSPTLGTVIASYVICSYFVSLSTVRNCSMLGFVFSLSQQQTRCMVNPSFSRS